LYCGVGHTSRTPHSIKDSPTSSWSSQDQRGGCEGVVGVELIDSSVAIAVAILYNSRSQRAVPPSHSIKVERDRACCTRLHWLVEPIPLNGHFTPGGSNAMATRDGTVGIAACL